MALLFLDSFDHYATANITPKWTQRISGGGTDSSAIGAFGRRGTNGWKASSSNVLANTGADAPSVTLSPTGAVCIAGFAFRNVTAFSATNSTQAYIFGIFDSGSVQCVLVVNGAGQLEFYRGLASGTLLGTSAFALSQDVDHYIEIKAEIDNSGDVTIRVDGVTVLTLTNVDTQSTSNASWNQVVIGATRTSSGSVLTWYYDDLYIADASGSDWNDLVGDIEIGGNLPNANGTTRNFTPSTGTDDFAVVDEAAANGDTDYLVASNVNDVVTMGFPNVAAGAVILGVQVVCQVKKTAAGSAGHKAVTRIGGTNYAGAEVGLTTSYMFARQVWEVKPSDASAWIDSDFNSAEFGAKKSA